MAGGARRRVEKVRRLRKQDLAIVHVLQSEPEAPHLEIALVHFGHFAAVNDVLFSLLFKILVGSQPDAGAVDHNKRGLVDHVLRNNGFANIGKLDTYSDQSDQVQGVSLHRILEQAPLRADGKISTSFGCRDAHLYALDAVTGKLVWKKFNDRGWVSVTPVVYEDKLMYTSGSSQRFVVLNKLSGDSVYQGKTNAFFSSPVIAGKTMYAGDFNGERTYTLALESSGAVVSA